MICSKCGAENAAESKFCSSCGAALEAVEAVEAVQEPVPEVPAEAPEAVTPEPQTEKKNPLAGLAAGAAGAVKTVGQKLKPVGEKLKPVAEKLKPVTEKLKPVTDKVKPILAKKPVKIGLAALACLLVVLIVVSAILSGNNGFLPADHFIRLVENGEDIRIIYDGKLLSDKIEDASARGPAYSIDGQVAAFTTSESELYVVNGKKLQKVAEDVLSFQLSVEGTGLAYISKDPEEPKQNLYLYNVKKASAVTVAKDYYGSYVLSPDGNSLCYSLLSDEGKLNAMYFDGEQSSKVASGIAAIYGMANKGKYIYIASVNDELETVLYCYSASGDKTKLSKLNVLDFYGSSICFNADHSQVLIVYDGKSYISAKGAEPQKASSDKLTLLIPESSRQIYHEGVYTYPVKDLYGHVYAASDDGSTNIWLIQKNADKSQKLLSKVSYAQVDESAEYLYYIDDDELRVTKISYGEKAMDKYVKLAEDVYDFKVTSDRSKVYYISDDSLYCINGENGKGKTTVANDDVTRIVLSSKDVCFYLSDGDVYASKNGKKGSRVLTDIESITRYTNGMILFISEDAVYVSTGSNKPTKLLDRE